MKPLALIGILLAVAGCQKAASLTSSAPSTHGPSNAYLDAVQLLDAESSELARAAGWNDYVTSAFLPDGFYPFEGQNLRGVAPKTKEEAAQEVKKAADYLAKQRQRVERARSAREAADTSK